MREQLRHAIRTARIEGRVLALRHRLHEPEHFRRRRPVITHLRIEDADAFEQIQRADAGHLGGRHRLIERDAHEALRREVIQFVGLRAFEQTQRRAEIGQIVLDEHADSDDRARPARACARSSPNSCAGRCRSPDSPCRAAAWSDRRRPVRTHR